MPRYFLGVGLLCLLFAGAQAEARRVTFDQDYAGPVASISTEVLTSPSGLAPVEITLHISAIDIDESRDGFQQVSVAGLFENAREGEPALSASGVLLAVPRGFHAKAELVEQKEKSLSQVYVAPYQHRSRCHSARYDNSFAFNSALYASSTSYPKNKVDIEEVGNLQGLRLIRVALKPLQAQLAQHTLTVTTDMKVRVTFESPRGEAISPLVLSPAFYDIAVGAIENRSAFEKHLTRARSESMVIVTADNLKSGLGPLVKWLAYKGIQTRVVTTSEAGGTKRSIKAMLQKLYDQPASRPSYLLMVGNDNTAPAWMEKVTFEDQTAVTDYPYSLLSGADIIPDLLYGRLLADNLDELKVQVDRWIQYEAFPEKNAGWYANATTIASSEGSSPNDREYAEAVARALKSYAYKQVDGFLEGEQTATLEKISAALNQGRSWVSYFGHGDGSAWQSTNGNVSVDEVSRLTNFARLPVIFDVACLNADYVTNQPCFGKAWVTAATGNRYAGAAAYYGGSVSISWHPPAIMSIGIVKSHFGKGLASLGASVLGGHLYLIQQMGSNEDAKDNLTWFNLFGNPAMYLRTSVPRLYEVQALSRTSGTKATVLTQATDKAGRGVAGLRAAALAANGMTLLDAGTTDQQGRVTLTVDRAQLKGLSISTTGYNAETRKVGVAR